VRLKARGGTIKLNHVGDLGHLAQAREMLLEDVGSSLDLRAVLGLGTKPLAVCSLDIQGGQVPSKSTS
jgi:hypothetical protein